MVVVAGVVVVVVVVVVVLVVVVVVVVAVVVVVVVVIVVAVVVVVVIVIVVSGVAVVMVVVVVDLVVVVVVVVVLVVVLVVVVVVVCRHVCLLFAMYRFQQFPSLRCFDSLVWEIRPLLITLESHIEISQKSRTLPTPDNHDACTVHVFNVICTVFHNFRFRDTFNRRH